MCVPVLGTILLVRYGTLCDGQMRLIGKSALFTLAQSVTAVLRDDVRALAAELEAAEWLSASEAAGAFPRARFSDHRLIIDLDQRHCAVVAIQYELGIALVEFAGPTLEWNESKRASKGRQP